MSRTRLGRMVRGLVVAAVVLAVATVSPVGATGGSVVAVPVGASGSTVYMSVTNTSLQPASAGLNLAITSGSTTLVGSSTVNVAPLSTTVVPVRMSGTLSLLMKVNLSSCLMVSVVDTENPF